MSRCYPRRYPETIFPKKKPVTHWITGKFNREASRLGDVGSESEARGSATGPRNAAMQHWV